MKRPPIKTYSIEAICEALSQAGIPYEREGRQINADVDHTGHHSYKITPSKGLFIEVHTNKGGTISALLRRLKIQVAAAPSHPAEGGHDGDTKKDKDTQKKALDMWGAGWTPTHLTDMPAGWDKKARNVWDKGYLRKKHEEERDAAIRYLTSRLGPEHLIHWLRHIRVGRDTDTGKIIMMVPMKHDDVVVGIQRVFLTPDGEKTKRMMLGIGKGSTYLLRPPAGVPLMKLGDHSGGKVECEGFETVAALVQASGWPGVTTFSDGGLINSAKKAAAKAHGKTKEQLESHVVIVGADSDESGAGQKAAAEAVRTLRAAGLKAIYAIPPSPENGGPKGGPKGSDWGDYPREGFTADQVRAHLALSIAQGDAELAKVPEERQAAWQDSSVVRSLSAVRPAQNPRPLVKTMTVEIGRKALNRIFDKFVEQAKAWQNGERLTPPRLGAEITFGMGKSHVLKRLIARLKSEGIKTVFVVKDTNEAQAYQAAGACWRHGREDMSDHGGFLVPQHCPKLALGGDLRESEHTPAAVLCGAGHCEHGNARALRIAAERGACPPEHAVTFFQRFPHLRNTASDHCWLDHQAESQHHTVVVVTAQGFGPQDTIWVYGDERVPRVIIVDEGVSFAHSQFANLDRLSEWLRAIEDLRKKKRDAGASTDDLDKLHLAFESIAQELGKAANTGGGYIDCPTITENIRALGFGKAYRAEADGAAGRWELPRWEQWITLLDAPLRAAREIAEATEHGTLSIRDGKLFLVYRNPIADLIGSHATLIADATLSPTAKAMITHLEGEIYRVIGKQQIDLTVDPARFNPAPRRDRLGRIDEADLAPQIEDAHQTLMSWRAEYGGKTYILLQKPKALRLLAKVTGMTLEQIAAMPRNQLWDLTIREGIGWWGWHDKAHNEWAGWHHITFDQPAIPRDVMGQQWEEHRALLVSMGVDGARDLPRYLGDGEDHWTQGQWTCTGKDDQQSRAGMYAEPTVQRFFQTMMDAPRMQGQGRSRALNSGTTIHALVCGGWPLAAAPDHGLTVAYKRVVGRVADAERKANEHEAALLQFDQAASRLVARGEAITREALKAECKATGTDGFGFVPRSKEASRHGGTNPQSTAPRAATYSDWLQRIAKIAPELYRHMVENGRGAAVVRAIKSSLDAYGKTAAKVAIEVTDGLLKQGLGAAWEALDEMESRAAETDVLPEYSAIVRVLAAALGADEGGVVPWDRPPTS